MSALALLLFALVPSESATPNVVVILADDLGWGDVSPLNPESRIPTPAFGRLAAEGMTFTDAHTSAAVCTPTRYALLTGRHCWRTRLKSGVLGGYSDPLIDPARQTIASLLRDNGYSTSCVGKWHLGLGWQWRDDAGIDKDNFGKTNAIGKVDFSRPISGGPIAVGFERSWVVPASLDMSPYVYVANQAAFFTAVDPGNRLPIIDGSPFPAFYRRGEIAPNFSIVETLDWIVAKAGSEIAAGAEDDRPFFLYLPLTAPHKPVMPHQRFVGRTELGPYGDFVAQVDDAIGRVLDSIDEAGTTDETIVIVTSDNGSFMRSSESQPGHVDDPAQQSFKPSNHRANGPWRGTKADIYEAGHRVPFFVRYPGVVAPGSRTDATVCQTDMLATLADLLGVEFDADSAEDSFSMRSVLFGDEASHDRRPLVSQSGNGMLAIREGSLKLIAGDGSGGREQPRGKPFAEPYQLYDLATDPGERTNLAASRSDDVKRLSVTLEAIAHGDEIAH